jgi:hypothetical protein
MRGHRSPYYIHDNRPSHDWNRELRDVDAAEVLTEVQDAQVDAGTEGVCEWNDQGGSEELRSLAFEWRAEVDAQIWQW